MPRPPLMTVTQDDETATALWSQVVVCKPGENYRIEATVRCNLTGAERSEEFDPSGFVLAVQPWAEDKPIGDRRTTPGLLSASEPTAVRTYFEAPDGVRRLRLSVGIMNARGEADILDVRFIQILELDAVSHVLAIPPPPYVQSSPRPSKRIAVCSETAQQRKLTHRLSAHFGESKVTVVTPKKLKAAELSADAILLPDRDPPPSIRSLTGLKKLAANRTVVISLPAFAKLSKGVLGLRRVEQDDDPIHAMVMYANHATRGFALHDIFPYAWAGKGPGSFVQNHFRRTGALKEFCKRHGFEVLLASMCDQDVTSNRPISLFHETSAGGLFVLDVEPAEAEPTTFAEPVLAMHLLLSILGQRQTHLGQYILPDDTEPEVRVQVREMATRFRHFVVHDADLPVDEVTEQLVTIGREDRTYGLPLTPKPVILVRSGLASGDPESVYGTFTWFKQLVRMQPHECLYAQPLASQFHLAWVPSVAPWEARNGWIRRGTVARSPMEVETDGRDVAALIDVVSRRIGQPRVVFSKEDGAFEHARTWLPRLAAAFPPGPCFAPYADSDRTAGDRDARVWRAGTYDVQVAVDPEAFRTEVHRQVRSAGGAVIRIEVPAYESDFSAYSIRSTDVTATLLEQVIGLQFGLIAVNRGPGAVRFDAMPPVKAGEALIVDRRDPLLRESASQVG
ncbi:MAG: hypothetical protein PVI86_06350 [Phycisphaerae bacterium]